jgi:hypothetical protein
VTPALQCEKKLPAGHVFGIAIGLEPSPYLAEDFGDASSSLGPMFVDHPLDERDISVVKIYFSDGYRQHD